MPIVMICQKKHKFMAKVHLLHFSPNDKVEMCFKVTKSKYMNSSLSCFLLNFFSLFSANNRNFYLKKYGIWNVSPDIK